MKFFLLASEVFRGGVGGVDVTPEIAPLANVLIDRLAGLFKLTHDCLLDTDEQDEPDVEEDEEEEEEEGREVLVADAPEAAVLRLICWSIALLLTGEAVEVDSR